MLDRPAANVQRESGRSRRRDPQARRASPALRTPSAFDRALPARSTAAAFPWNDGALALRVLRRRTLDQIQAQVRLPLFRVESMTRETLVRQNRTNVAVERKLRTRGGRDGDKKQWQQTAHKGETISGGRVCHCRSLV